MMQRMIVKINPLFGIFDFHLSLSMKNFTVMLVSSFSFYIFLIISLI